MADEAEQQQQQQQKRQQKQQQQQQKQHSDLQELSARKQTSAERSRGDELVASNLSNGFAFLKFLPVAKSKVVHTVDVKHHHHSG